jgi:hypothetical protein
MEPQMTQMDADEKAFSPYPRSSAFICGSTLHFFQPCQLATPRD